MQTQVQQQPTTTAQVSEQALLTRVQTGDVDAMNQLMRPVGANLSNTHEGRRAIEALGEDYEKLNYYERKLYSLQALLIEKDVFTDAEFDAKLAEVRSRYEKA